MRKSAAFTLLELLVVVAILILLLSLGVPAISSLARSGNVNSGGRLLSNLVTAARSQAINQRTLVRVEIATSWPPDSSESFRKITTAQYDQTTSSFRQVGRWETLPSGTVIELHDMYSTPPTDVDTTPTPSPSRGTYITDLFQPNGPLSLDTNCSIGGQQVSSVYFEFLPTGALNTTSNPVWVRMSPGVLSGSTITHTARGLNYIDVVVDNLVGRVKFSHP